MCDYSLQAVKSRAAKVGDKLTTNHFGSGTRGFATAEDLATAVCVLPGTELAFAKPIRIVTPGVFYDGGRKTAHTTAIFRQVDKEVPDRHHDALELPDGELVLLTNLCEGQSASVLQVPAKPVTPADVEHQRRAAYVG
jgi:hypothetical protein